MPSNMPAGYSDEGGAPDETITEDDVRIALAFLALTKAAKSVCRFDWSGNDDDAVAAIDALRESLKHC